MSRKKFDISSTGGRIKFIRISHSLNQRVFAEKIGTSSGYISEIESNKSKPGSDFLCSINRVFKINLNWLLTCEGPIYLKEISPEEDTEKKEVIKSVREILESNNNTVINALKTNIEAFLLTVRLAQEEEARVAKASKRKRRAG